MSKADNCVWLASIYDSGVGVSTLAFSTEAKALAWKADTGIADGREEGPPWVTIKCVGIDSLEHINEG
jgi:hypothetical protein